VRHGFSTYESALIEQPLIVGVELLERVVRQDDGIRLIGNCKDKRVASTDCSGRGRDDFVVLNGCIELGNFGRIDAVPKRGVNNHGDHICGVFGHVGLDRLAQLFEAGHRPSLGGEIGAIDDDVFRHS
jgi:hypothetical protein